jgi:hypothetical protein
MAPSPAKAKEQKGKGGKVVGGAAVVIAAVAAAAAAGTYFFTGKRGEKNRKTLKGWAVRAKGEIIERMEKLQEVDAEKYLDIVESVLKRYNNIKDINVKDLEALRDELKDSWKDIEKSLKGKKAAAKKPAAKSSAKPAGKRK